MRKIMFNDRYDLTLKVLSGQKTQTRREAYDKPMQYEPRIGYEDGHLILLDGWFRVAKSLYREGEEVAVAQCYEDAILSVGEEEWNKLHKWYCIDNLRARPGLHNKMFVRADLMPHRIRIKSIKAERLQNISTEDCLKEGLDEDCGEGIHPYWWHIDPNRHEDWRKISDEVARHGFDRHGKPCTFFWETAQSAYKALIDRLDKTMWERNPWVFVYDFELIK